MRTTFNAADSLSVVFLMTLVPQCLGRPASALFGRGHKALPLAERRDSAIGDRRESVIERRESVISRRESIIPQDVAEDVEAFDGHPNDVPLIMDHKHQRLWLKRDQGDTYLEQSEAVDKIIRDLGYDDANIEARQLSSSYYQGFQTSSSPTASTVLTSSISTTNAQTSILATSYLATSSLASATTPSSSSASFTATSTFSSSSSSTSLPSSSSTSPSTSSTSISSQSSFSSTTTFPASTYTSSSSSTSVTSAGAATLLSSSHTSSTTITSVYPTGAANRTAIIVPVISSTKVLGTASHAPMMTYVAGQKAAPLPTLGISPSIATIDSDMQTAYPLWNGSGSLVVNSGNANKLASLATTPLYSRDQGKGGNVNGVNMFIFADTGSYTAPTAQQGGNFTGFVSNSLAVDRGLGPVSGKAVTLSDPIGSYANNKGVPRGFFPLTAGEQAYNNLMIPYGQRFAIWPESSITPLNPTTGILFAPIVYANTTGGYSFTFAGTTLVEITVPSIGGPVANRVAPLLFPKGGVEWGCVGAIRSYGPNGVNGGKVYVLGNHKTGLFIGRTNATTVTDPTSYEFFQSNGTWNSTMPTPTSSNVFVTGAYSSVDIFYSPRHLTFIMVYQDIYCDNTLFWRYLQAPKPILPKYAGGSWDDIVVAITMYPWSKAAVLLSLPVPAIGYTYGGGIHPNYFGANDITRGGNQMLVSWTAPTGQSSNSLASYYATMSGMITWA